jgi:two-component sensor histidine kinase
VYRETGDYKNAQYYLEKGVKMSIDVENQGLNITLINNLASVYSKQGFKNKAIKLQEEALERARTLSNYLRELQVLYGLAKTYGKDEPSKAVFYLNEAVLLARKKANYNQETRYLKVIIPFYLEEGNYRQAYLMKEREHKLADSFYYNTMSKNIESLKAEYELSKSNAKVKELALLNNKRQLELEKANILRNVTFTGIGLLLIILVLLYNQYRIKQRSNKEISNKNLSLQHLLDEKEWLLKEVHHRVKNNLHTVMSLLETQSAYLKDDALAAVQNSQHRVYAMSLIHQKLYQLENSTNINMSVYLPELIDYLRDSFDVHQRIRFRCIIEDIQLDISKAIPIGLILNEAVTNSIKYAFPGNAYGEIQVEMTRTENNLISLSVKDNGIGLPVDWKKIQKNSLGLKLMGGLSEDIHGKFSIERMNGTEIKVEFPGDLVVKELKKKANIQMAELVL